MGRGTARDKDAEESGGWDDAHQRVTFYCPRDLVQAIEAEMAASGRSKSRVIVDAVRAHLRVHEGGAAPER